MKEICLIDWKNTEFQDVLNEWMKIVNELQHKLHENKDHVCIPWTKDTGGTQQSESLTGSTSTVQRTSFPHWHTGSGGKNAGHSQQRLLWICHSEWSLCLFSFVIPESSVKSSWIWQSCLIPILGSTDRISGVWVIKVWRRAPLPPWDQHGDGSSGNQSGKWKTVGWSQELPGP